MKLKLNKKNGIKILKGTGIAGGAASLAYLLQIIPSVDFGQYSEAVVAVFCVAINTLRKLLAEEE